MENKEYLSEETYKRNNEKVKKVGKTLLIIGVVVLVISFILIILGVVGFGNTASNSIELFNNDKFDDSIIQQTAGGVFKNFGLFAIGGFINSIGFMLAAAGGITMIVTHRREITAYTVQQTMPLAKEGVEKMAPTIGNAAGEIAKGITKGINEAKNSSSEQNK